MVDVFPADVLDALDFALRHDIVRGKRGGPTLGNTPLVRKRARSLEARLRKFLTGAWNERGKAVTAQAVAHVASGSGAVGAGELSTVLGSVAKAMGPAFRKAVTPTVAKSMSAIYDLGRSAVAPPRFNQVDKAAKKWLAQDQMYWVGEHYGTGVGDAVAKTAREVIVDAGLGRAEAGKALKAILGDTFPKSDGYWRGVAANAASRSRNFGCVESMAQAGYVELEIVAMMDEATSDICREMNGKIFRVEWAVQQRDAMMAADSPEAVKALAAWPKSVQEIKDRAPEALAKAGVTLPPYHFHCRTIAVVRI